MTESENGNDHFDLDHFDQQFWNRHPESATALWWCKYHNEVFSIK